MGLPSISIRFSTSSSTAITRSSKGIVAVIVHDATTAVQGNYSLTAATQIPSGLGTVNAAYVAQAFLGYLNQPKKVLLCVVEEEPDDLTAATDWLATQLFDYLAGPHDITAAEVTELKAWVLSQRTNQKAPIRAVLPDCEADSEAIINFTTDGIVVGEDSFDAPEYCARIAGLIAGTPMTISCLYAPLSEVSDITRLTRTAIDEAIDDGEFVLIHDGTQVKVASSVNSLTTLTDTKGAAFQKIKIVETTDMIDYDIRTVCEDTYIGKYANSYDNKMVLCVAIRSYLEGLESDGILDDGTSSVDIDVTAQTAYLESIGTDTSEMTEDEIRRANTGDKVFLTATISILDVIEDITLDVSL